MMFLHSCLALLFAIRSLAQDDASAPNTTCVVDPSIRAECVVTSSSDFESRSHSYYPTNPGDDSCAHPTSDRRSTLTTSPPSLKATAVISDTPSATCPTNDPGALCGGSCCAVGQYCHAGETCLDASAGLPTPTLIAASSATETSSPMGMNATTTLRETAGAASTSYLNSSDVATAPSTAATYTGAAARSLDETGVSGLAWGLLSFYALSSVS